MTESAPDPDRTQSDPEPKNPAPQSPRRSQSVQVADKVDSSQIAHFVMTIKNAEQQVGEHIIAALQYPDTVAVLTTAVMTPDGQQRVVSAALNAERMQQVQEILNAAGEEREEEDPCVGFHCLVKPRVKDGDTEGS
jgi:hypothetical protein